jgi:hypothetical protein
LKVRSASGRNAYYHAICNLSLKKTDCMQPILSENTLTLYIA